tara:strand:- start:6036 stop:6530 length:495 start_codon:yes stop_codon:yes gene_type:complete
MKRLYVVRHADSSWDNRLLSDFERPLSNKGHLEAQQISDYLINKNYKVDFIIHSSAERTTETAKYIHQNLSKNNALKIFSEKLLYLTEVNDVIKILNIYLKDYQSILYVGHNPTITSLVNYISNANIDHIPSSGLSVIDINKYRLQKSSGDLIEFIYPKKIKFL